VHIDPDASAFGRCVATSLGITASAGTLVQSLKSGRPPQAIHQVNLPAPTSPTIPENQGDSTHPLEVMRELDALLPPNATVCADVGTCIFWTFQGIPVRRPGTFFATIDFSPMGCGIAGAIGIALARPDGHVICVAGDGAFLMHGTEVS